MKKLIKSISKKEKYIVWSVIIGLIIILAIPFFYLFITAPDGYDWTGLHILTPGDYNHYFGYMEQVKDGHFLFIDHFTGEEQVRNIFRPEWLAAGLIAKWTTLDNRLVFQIFRSLLIIPFLWMLYVFISYFFKSFKKRMYSFLFIIFSSGIGFVFFLFQGLSDCYAGDFFQYPMDLWVPEINAFMSAFNSPHLIYSFILILFILLMAFIGFEKNKLKYFIYGGLATKLLIISHPFHLLLVFGLICLILLIKIIQAKKLFISHFFHVLVFSLLTLPAIIYQGYLFMFDDLTQIRAIQNVCLTTTFSYTLISLGFILVFALVGVIFMIKHRKLLPEKLWYLVIWVVFQFALIYSPIAWQRRMIETMSVPLGLLAVVGILYLAKLIKQKNKFIFDVLKNKFIILILVVLVLALSNVSVYLNDFQVQSSKKGWHFVYFPEYVYTAFDWLDQNVADDDLVFADPYMGNYIPGRTGLSVYAGHGVETAYFQSKNDNTVWFFKDETDLEKKIEFLSQNSIDYIFFADYPFVLVEEYPVPEFLSNEKYFKPVFSHEGVIIYEVVSYVYSKPCNCD